MLRDIAYMVLFALVMSSCSYSGGGGDGGSGDGDAGRPDYDPSGSLLLTIPQGTSLCSGFSEGRTWEQELAMVAVIELAPGYYVLEREEGSTQAGGFIRRVLFGPEKKVSEPSASMGTLEAQHGGWGTWEDWTYTFTVPMLLAQAEAAAHFRFFVSVENGAWPAEINLDQNDVYWWAAGEFRIAPATDFNTQVQRFALCDLPDPPVRDITATGANGDQIKLMVRQGPYYESCLCTGETQCFFLTRAEVKLGGYSATVEDRFRLIYNGSHHNWYDKYLILLDPPADDVHAVLAIAPGFNGLPNPEPEFVYLDSDLAELRRESQVDWQTSGNP